MKYVLICLVVSVVVGCAQPGRTPWDPPEGRSLFEQIPNWDGAASRICGGRLTPEEAQRQGRSTRC